MKTVKVKKTIKKKIEMKKIVKVRLYIVKRRVTTIRKSAVT